MDEERIRNVRKTGKNGRQAPSMQFNDIESSPIWRGARRQIPPATALIRQMIFGAVFIGVRGDRVRRRVTCCRPFALQSCFTDREANAI
jgi:hypothetical protein